MILVVLPISFGLTGLVIGPAQAAPALPAGHVHVGTLSSCADRPVGTWSADVSTTIPSSGTVTYNFQSDGTMTLTAGTASVTGTWQAGQGDDFTFVIDNQLTDANGNVTGHAHAVQNGVLQGRDSFTSSGPTVEYDLNGNVIKTFQVNVTATRSDS